MWFPGSGCEEDGIEGTVARVVQEGGGDVIAWVLFLDEDKVCPESLDFPMVESEKKIEIFGEEREKKKIWQEMKKEKIN